MTTEHKPHSSREERRAIWKDMPPAFRPTRLLHRLTHGHEPDWDCIGGGYEGGGTEGDAWNVWECLVCGSRVTT